MKHITILYILIIQLIGCQTKPTIIRNNNIKTIEIRFFEANRPYLKKIHDENSLKEIIAELNKAKIDPAVFIAQYKLTVIYNDGTEQLIICNGNRIKINGVTYKLKRSINEILRASNSVGL